jgi:hypothetical protein
VHLKRIATNQKKFLKFALRTLGWCCDIELPPRCQRCRLIDMDVLSSRRRVSCALFISDVLSCKLHGHIILSSLRLNVYLYNTRYRILLGGSSSPNKLYGMNGTIRIFNKFSDLFEFGGSRDGFRARIKERMRQYSSCVCCPRS